LAADEVEVEILDDRRARAAGSCCGVKRTADVIDASVVLGARERGDRVVTRTLTASAGSTLRSS